MLSPLRPAVRYVEARSSLLSSSFDVLLGWEGIWSLNFSLICSPVLLESLSRSFILKCFKVASEVASLFTCAETKLKLLSRDFRSFAEDRTHLANSFVDRGNVTLVGTVCLAHPTKHEE